MIDRHAHLLDSKFDDDRSAVIARLQEAGGIWIEVGTTLEDSRRVLDFPYASVGAHPNDIYGLTEKDWQELASLASNPHCCAIGEVGLDFSRDGVLTEQEEVLRRFIVLAQEKKLPLIFHVRSGNGIDAHQELLRILKTYPERPLGVIHTFGGTLSQAKEYISLGMMISFSGVITFKNAGELPEVATIIPLGSILVETDCPYLTPEPYRGMRNEPLYVKYVIQKIADFRRVSFEEIEKATEQNTRILFGLK